jgi:hypothetical protein
MREVQALEFIKGIETAVDSETKDLYKYLTKTVKNPETKQTRVSKFIPQSRLSLGARMCFPLFRSSSSFPV